MPWYGVYGTGGQETGCPGRDDGESVRDVPESGGIRTYQEGEGSAARSSLKPIHCNAFSMDMRGFA